MNKEYTPEQVNGLIEILAEIKYENIILMFIASLNAQGSFEDAKRVIEIAQQLLK